MKILVPTDIDKKDAVIDDNYIWHDETSVYEKIETLQNQLSEYLDNLDEELYYHKGDTITLNSMIMSGFLTSSSTAEYFSVVLPKKMSSDISSISCSYLYVENRGINGYLNSASGYTDYASNSSYTITCSKAGANTLRCILKKSSAFTNNSNNTPIALYGSITLKFS